MKRPRVFYAGDGPWNGPARYLCGVLEASGFDWTHVPPGEKIRAAAVRTGFDLFIFSDYPAADLKGRAETAVLDALERGAGLLMVGGFGSFSGPFGQWENSRIADYLPVRCLARDDRTRFPRGALVQPLGNHPITAGLPWSDPPSICGLNKVGLRRGSRVVLEARPILYDSGSFSLSSRGLPLLVLGEDSQRRSAAYTSDFAPHWCAGLVDWGKGVRKVRLSPGTVFEVGEAYFLLISRLLKWLSARSLR